MSFRNHPLIVLVLLAAVSFSLVARADKDPDAELRAKGQKRADEMLALDEAAMGDIAARKLFGMINKVDGFEDDPNSKSDWAAGAMTPIYVQENKAFKKRVGELLRKKYGGKNDSELYSKVLPREYCLAKLRFEGRKDDKSIKFCTKTRNLGRKGWGYDDPILVGLLLDAVIDPLEPETQKNIRTLYVNTMGHERKRYKYQTMDTVRKGIANKDTIYGVQVLNKPASEWTYRTVRYARDYAKQHGLTKQQKQLGKLLKKAPRYQCKMLERVFFIQDHEGGGKYGKKRAGSWGLRGAETIDCKKAKKVKKTKWAWKLLKKKKDYSRVEKWVSVKASGDWEVERNNLGVPKRKVQEATIYWREEI